MWEVNEVMYVKFLAYWLIQNKWSINVSLYYKHSRVLHYSAYFSNFFAPSTHFFSFYELSVAPVSHSLFFCLQAILLFCRILSSHLPQGFPCSSAAEESACNAGDPGSIPGSGRSAGEGNGNPLQYSGLENPMDRGAWRAKPHDVERVGHNLATKPPHLLHLFILLNLYVTCLWDVLIWYHLTCVPISQT